MPEPFCGAGSSSSSTSSASATRSMATPASTLPSRSTRRSSRRPPARGGRRRAVTEHLVGSPAVRAAIEIRGSRNQAPAVSLLIMISEPKRAADATSIAPSAAKTNRRSAQSAANASSSEISVRSASHAVSNNCLRPFFVSEHHTIVRSQPRALEQLLGLPRHPMHQTAHQVCHPFPSRLDLSIIDKSPPPPRWTAPAPWNGSGPVRGPRADRGRDCRPRPWRGAAGCRGFLVNSPTETLLGMLLTAARREGNPEAATPAKTKTGREFLHCYSGHLHSGPPLARQAKARGNSLRRLGGRRLLHNAVAQDRPWGWRRSGGDLPRPPSRTAMTSRSSDDLQAEDAGLGFTDSDADGRRSGCHPRCPRPLRYSFFEQLLPEQPSEHPRRRTRRGSQRPDQGPRTCITSGQCSLHPAAVCRQREDAPPGASRSTLLDDGDLDLIRE